MTSDRSKQIAELYHAALARRAEDRPGFLAEACGDDDALREKLESLLAQPISTAEILDLSTAASAARMVAEATGSTLAGARLGRYQLQARLGAGGMGEVYRAHDTKLGRHVAIKILPRAFTSEPERLTRFEREARMLAALNHPNIGSIYGVEQADDIRGLVLELVDGDTLADRVARGPIPLNDALSIGRQIAEALEAAHGQGIVHRDLKPANIMITAHGVVKVVDFGLAKPALPRESTPNPEQLQMIGPAATLAGVLLGTAAYMSPEQIRGQSIDARSDIWSFGCVLYEMLAACTAFAAATMPDTLAAVLARNPDWTPLQAVPRRLVHLIQRCLEKDADRRPSDVAEIRRELDECQRELDRRVRRGWMSRLSFLWR